MRNLAHIKPQSEHFSPNLGHFFPIFEKGQKRPTPYPLWLCSWSAAWLIEKHGLEAQHILLNMLLLVHFIILSWELHILNTA